MTNIFKIDKPIYRKTFFIISIIIFLLGVIRSTFISPIVKTSFPYASIARFSIEFLFTIFFTYINCINDSKRLWDICDNKKLAIWIAISAAIINIISIILAELKIVGLGFAISVLLTTLLYYLCLLFIPSKFFVKFN